MILSRSRVSALALALLVLACGSPNEPEVNAIVEVKVQSILPTFGANGEDRWMSFTVPLTVRNLGRSELRIAFCSSAVEVETDSGWKRAWSPICMVAGDTNTIAVGSSRDLDIHVTAGLSGQYGQPWGGHPGANYRAVVGLVTERTDGLIPRFASGVFSLVEE